MNDIGTAISFSARKYNPAILGPKKIMINVVIPIFENALNRFEIDQNFKKSIYFLKFLFMLFLFIS